jgi:hypothetical protein
MNFSQWTSCHCQLHHDEQRAADFDIHVDFPSEQLLLVEHLLFVNCQWARSSCGNIMADKEKQSQLAWHLRSWFQEDSGRPSLSSGSEASEMVHCHEMLSNSESKVLLEFFLETSTLCHQLQ